MLCLTLLVVMKRWNEELWLIFNQTYPKHIRRLSLIRSSFNSPALGAELWRRGEGPSTTRSTSSEAVMVYTQNPAWPKLTPSQNILLVTLNTDWVAESSNSLRYARKLFLQIQPPLLGEMIALRGKRIQYSLVLAITAHIKISLCRILEIRLRRTPTTQNFNDWR